MAEKVTRVTQDGLNKIKAELDYLTGTVRREVAEKLKEARSYGDLSENAEYDDAKNEQAQLEARIQLLESKLKNIKVVSDDEIRDDIVDIGSSVVVWDTEFEEEVTYKIVGSSEVDLINNHISDESPVGVALMNKVVGDKVTIETPGGSVILEIRAISR